MLGFSTIESAIERIVQSYTRELYTASVAYVESYDPKNKTIVAVPVVSEMLETDGEPINLDSAPIPDVPVLMLRFGQFYIEAPLTKGSKVLLVHTRLPIDEWWVSDGLTPVVPALLETHAESDCIAIPGLWPLGDNPETGDGECLVISTMDGSVRITLDPTGPVSITGSRVNLGDKSANTAVAKGTTTDDNLGIVAAKFDLVAGVLGIPPIGLLPSTKSGKAFTND